MKEEDEHGSQELDEDVARAVEAYFTFFGKLNVPAGIAPAIEAIRREYDTTRQLRPTQVALLQRCFMRGRASQYEVDWLPIGLLDNAIADELDGNPMRMLRGDEIAQAIGWLAMRNELTDEEKEWHRQTEEQLLLTGWLSPEQMTSLKHRYLASLNCAIAVRWPQQGVGSR